MIEFIISYLGSQEICSFLMHYHQINMTTWNRHQIESLAKEQ